MRRLLIGAILACLVACSGEDPWTMKGAPKAIPDEQVRTGVEAGADYWIWHCYEGQRVEIRRSSSAFCGAGPNRMTKSACDPRLFPERNEGARAHELPDPLRWPGSPPPDPSRYERPDDAGAFDAASE
jgi:hypothetical protein